MTLLKTVLHSHHLNLKAKMAEFGGFDMPIQYSGVKDEVLAVRKSVGVFDVSHMGEFWVTGPEASKFVDHIITNEFASSPEGKAVYSPLCREDGTIVDDLIAYKISNDKVLICVNASNIKKDWDWIKQFANSFKINLENHSDNISLLAIQGPESTNHLIKLNEKFSSCLDMPYYGVKEFNLGHQIVIARTGYTGEDGFEVFAPNNVIVQYWETLMKNGVMPCGLAARDVLRLEVCYPLYGHEISDDNTPFDAALKWTVKLKKANFIGKNTLLNTKPKTKLVKLICSSGIPRQGYSITNKIGETIGSVTSGTHSVTLGKGIGLALVNIEKFVTPNEYFVVIRDKSVPIEIIEKPFVIGGHK